MENEALPKKFTRLVKTTLKNTKIKIGRELKQRHPLFNQESRANVKVNKSHRPNLTSQTIRYDVAFLTISKNEVEKTVSEG